MTDNQYLLKMISLTNKLERAASAEPYDPDAYNEIVSRLNAVTPPLEQRRRRRPWAALVFCIFLLIILVWLVYEVLNVLYTKGIQ